MTFFQRLFNVGVRAELPENEKSRVRLTNQLAFTLIWIALSYTIFSLVFYPSLTWIPVLGFVAIAVAYVLSHFAEYIAGRVLLVTMPVTLAFLYNIFLSKPGEAPIAGLLALQLALMMMPFLLFTFKERLALIGTGLYCLVSVVLFHPFNNLVDSELDSTMMRSPEMETLTIALAALLIIGKLFILMKSSQEIADQNKDLLDDMNARNNALNDAQEEQRKYLEEVEAAQEAEKQRSWASEGISQIGTLLRDRQNLSETSQRVISLLVKYLGASVGGVFILEEPEDGSPAYLDLKGCYAFERQKFMEKRVELGVGLVGQTYLEAEPTHLTEIPEDHLRVRSGLGDAPPRSMLIVPMIANEKVEGIIELASFKTFDQHTIEFLENVGETIAAALSNIRINEATQKLLEATRIQAEELKAQEEEMRQNMEELVATQEELSRKNIESEDLMSNMQNWQFDVKSILDGVPGTIMVVDQDGILEDMNRSGELLTGETKASIEGRSIDEFITKRDWKTMPFDQNVELEVKTSENDRVQCVVSKSRITKVSGDKFLFLIRSA